MRDEECKYNVRSYARRHVRIPLPLACVEGSEDDQNARCSIDPQNHDPGRQVQYAFEVKIGARSSLFFFQVHVYGVRTGLES